MFQVQLDEFHLVVCALAPFVSANIIRRAIENLSIPLDRAHRAVLGTRMGALEHVAGRILC